MSDPSPAHRFAGSSGNSVSKLPLQPPRPLREREGLLEGVGDMWRMVGRLLAPAVAQIEGSGSDDPVVEALPELFKNENLLPHPAHGPIVLGPLADTPLLPLAISMHRSSH